MRSEVAATLSLGYVVGGWICDSHVQSFSPVALWHRFCDDLIFQEFTG